MDYSKNSAIPERKSPPTNSTDIRLLGSGLMGHPWLGSVLTQVQPTPASTTPQSERWLDSLSGGDMAGWSF